MFTIKICGGWGSCYADAKGDPVFSTDKAMKFKTRQDAADYIGKHYKEWENVCSGEETMTVEQI
jgi:hypothetical protein